VNLKDEWVNFRVRDVYMPEPEQVLQELHGNDILQGRVVAISDNQLHDGCFAVIEVQGAREPLIVPLKGIVSIL
jgi:hypothetical protein